jgi:hypothetical protein
MKSLNTNKTRRRFVLGLFLLVAGGAAGAAWYWNLRVHAPDPAIVIRTEAEAVEGARNFLAAAHVSTSAYDLSRTSGITKDRMKGRFVWRIVWLPIADAILTNKLSVVVSETGWFYRYEKSSTNSGVWILQGDLIQGDVTNITRQQVNW